MYIISSFHVDMQWKYMKMQMYSIVNVHDYYKLAEHEFYGLNVDLG